MCMQASIWWNAAPYYKHALGIALQACKPHHSLSNACLCTVDKSNEMCHLTFVLLGYVPAYQIVIYIHWTYFRSNFTALHGRFSTVHRLLAQHSLGVGSLDGILVDAGASSMQFDDGKRGFSISQDGPLDMRMNQNK